MRRGIIFAIVVSMSLLAPMPVPACGFFSSQIAECEAAQRQMQCDGIDMRMGVHDDVSHLAPCCDQSMSGCLVNHVPAPATQNKSDMSIAPIGRVSVEAVANTLFIPQQQVVAFHRHEISPHRIQSLLCIFQI